MDRAVRAIAVLVGGLFTLLAFSSGWLAVDAAVMWWDERFGGGMRWHNLVVRGITLTPGAACAIATGITACLLLAGVPLLVFGIRRRRKPP